MNQLEFFQNALANSVEILINTEAHVMSHLKWIAEEKRAAVERMAKGKIFNYDDIGSPDDPEQSGIEHNVDMKVVAVNSQLNEYNIIRALKCSNRSWLDSLFSINVVFLRDPEPLLKSKAKLTVREANILKKMSDYYQLKICNPTYVGLMTLKLDLRQLKHKYNMAFECQWYYGFNDILDRDILKTGLRVGNVSITSRNS